MKVIIQPDAQGVTQYAYEFVRRHMQRKPGIVLGLATGSTPVNLYKAMIEGYRRGELDFSGVRTFNLDEYVGLGQTHPQSYFHFMKVNLFDHVNFKPEHIHFLSGLPEDVEQHCEEYEAKIAAAGGIDVQVLGIGRVGHIGFNEPTSSMRSRTRDKTLTRETLEDNRKCFEHEADVPRWALTMGVGTILDSRHILLLATGRQKARAIKDMVEGPLTSMCPGSALQLHPSVTVVCDEVAAAKLDHDQYYRWMQENDCRMYELLNKKTVS
jgi:glucosamine-6-phosphate deaminase